MNNIKLLGLAAFTALALTALAGVASASSPGFFVAGSYPATLKGEATGARGELSTNVGTSLCTSPVLTGTLNKAGETLTPSAEYKECNFNPKMNGCEFTFHPPSSGINGSFDIGGSKCKGISGTQLSPILILPQSGLAATFQNEGSGTSATVKVQAQATGLKYEVTEGKSKGTYSNGTYQTTWSLRGEAAGKSTGVSVVSYPGLSIVGEGEGRKFHSDLYPATIGGEQVKGTVGGISVEKIEFTTAVGSMRCNTMAFSSPSFLFPEGQPEDTGELSLSPTYGACSLVGGVPVSVTPETNCVDDLNVSGVFAGSLGVCEIKIQVTGSQCAITVPAQIRSGLEFANVGTGSSAQVEAKVNAGGFTYQVISGKNCPNKPAEGVHSDGKYKGVILLEVAKVN